MYGTNPNIPHFPHHYGGIQGGLNVILSRSQYVLPSSISQDPPPLKFTLVLIKRTMNKNEITQFDSFPSEILHTINMWYFGLVYHKKIDKVFA